MRSGSWGYAQIDARPARIANPNPSQRLRIGASREGFRAVADEFLKDGRVEAIADVLALALGGHEPRALEHSEMVRHRREGDREFLGQLTRRAITTREALEDAATGRVGQRAKERIPHDEII